MEESAIMTLVTLVFNMSNNVFGSDIAMVTTDLGKIEGYFKNSFKGRRYEVYEGVPFAIPPIGSRRFEPPEPITPWSGVLSAKNDPNICVQYLKETKTVIGDEDCLYLNVYTPRIHSQSLLPVILWFHGGGFQTLSGNYTKAKYIMDRDVIFVTTNYRLGPLGFLSTEDEVVPGNTGLKDQNMALRWVHQNIRAFGGDPQKISLLGSSAGAASVHYHYLSPMSAGLFRNGMSFSWTALRPMHPHPLEHARRLASLVSCNSSSNTLEMVNCLKARSASDLVAAGYEILNEINNLRFFYTIFGPVVEKVDKNYFLNKLPEEILNSGQVYDVPWVTGVVSEDGIASVGGLIRKESILRDLDDNWNTLSPYLLEYNYTVPENLYIPIAQAAKQAYIGSEPLHADDRTTQGLIYMLTDVEFMVPVEKATRLQALATKSPVYSYYYSYRANQSHSEKITQSTENFGVSHLDDVYLVLENPEIDPTRSPTDQAMLEKLLDFWYSTITTGKPDLGVQWPRVNPYCDKFHYMHIRSPSDSRAEFAVDYGHKKFWNSVGL